MQLDRDEQRNGLAFPMEQWDRLRTAIYQVSAIQGQRERDHHGSEQTHTVTQQGQLRLQPDPQVSLSLQRGFK